MKEVGQRVEKEGGLAAGFGRYDDGECKRELDHGAGESICGRPTKAV